MYQLYRDRPHLVLCIILANICLSAWCLYLDPIINFDGVTYTSIAKLFLEAKAYAAFEHYSWPFYSLFIAVVAKILFIDVETAAYVLNTLFAISLTLAFVCIVAELSNNNRRMVMIAMVVILLFPSISKYRSFIIRDFGYLSCYLWSLYFIFRFCAQTNKNYLIGWIVFAALSSLFRFEGIVFMLIAPYFLFLFGATSIPHRKKVLAALSLVIASSSAAIIFWYVNDKYTDSVEANQHINSLWDFFASNIQTRLNGEPLSPLTFAGLLLDNSSDVVYELIRRMAIFYFLFAIYAYIHRLALQQDLPRKIWLIYLLTNIAMLVAFSLSNNFLVSRYTMATALTLLILAPFALDRLISVYGSSGLKTKLSIGLVLALLVAVSLEGLNVKTNKGFIKQGGLWMKQNLPAEATIYSNNKLAIYYSDRGVEANLDMLYSQDMLKQFIKTREVRRFDYVAIVANTHKPSEDLARQTLSFYFGIPLKIFFGENDDNLFIFSTTFQERD